MLPVFVYGTLCIPEVRNTLLRRAVLGTDAVLAGASVRRTTGQTYPTLVLRQAGEHAPGLILHDLGAAERGVLRAFEPPVYDLIEVQVQASDEPAECLAFVHCGGRAATAEPWSPTTFTGDAYRAFLREVERATEALWRGGEFDLDGVRGGDRDPGA